MAARIAVLAITAVLVLAASMASAADLYQWKDANGVSHYSDAPPPKGTYHSRAMHDSGGIAVAPAVGNTVARNPGSTNCATAQSNLDRLKSADPVGLDADGDGKPDATMSDAQRAQQLILAQHNITLYCKPVLPNT